MWRLNLISKVRALRCRTLSGAWSELWETDPPVFPVRLGAGARWPRVRRITPAFLASALLHCSMVFFLYSIPFAILWRWSAVPPARKISSHPRMIALGHLSVADYLPVIHPPGRRKDSGQRATPGTSPRLGSHFDPRITIISNPPHPDNYRLTLETENAPADLMPPPDAKVPDLISGGPPPSPEAAGSASPAPAQADSSTAPAPNVAPPPQPRERQALTPPVKPAAPPPPPALAPRLPDIPAPHLEVPLPPPVTKVTTPVAEAASAPTKAAPQENTHAAPASPEPPANNPSATPAASDAAKPGGGPRIMALSVDPVPLKDLTAIPAGVREGAFSISPAGAAPGTPGGAPGAPPDAGEGGHGPGGDKSVASGNGSGSQGGGGQGSSAPGPAVSVSAPGSPAVSVSGSGGGSGISAGTLPPLKPEDLVYAVKPETPKARAPRVVVSSGPWGGGGLRLFGALHGDKIYTIYFSMPGKNWVLQYCAHEKAPPVDASARVVEIHILPPLTPPAAIEQFDFHRPPAPPDATQGMIILHGIIHEDGRVTDLAALEGADPILNAAACAAFSRWKFKPALRAGAPVALEILVGIP